jgi:ATP-dependent DNA helicase RecG
VKPFVDNLRSFVDHFSFFSFHLRTIAIEKLKNSIVINNKGELLFPEKEFGRKSEARNRLLVDLLARTDFMEKAGTGIKRITNACVNNGNKVHFEFSDSFWLTIHPNKSQVGEKVGENVTENVPENKKRLYAMVELIRNNRNITMQELAHYFEKDIKTIKRDIVKLKEQNIIKRIGPDKGGHWEVVK